jgi:transcriptional regulator with XRE-family HTH domain
MDNYRATYNYTSSITNNMRFSHTIEMPPIDPLWITKTRKLMRDRKLTQLQVADRLGVTVGGFSHWMTGIREPRYDTIKEIATILKVPVTELLVEQDNDEAEIIVLFRSLSHEDQQTVTSLMQSLSSKSK